MCHKRQALNQRFQLMPHFGEKRCVFSIFVSDAVHAGIEPRIVVGSRLHETVKAVGDLSIAYNHHAHSAHAGVLFVGGLKINSGKVFHLLKKAAAKLQIKFDVEVG